MEHEGIADAFLTAADATLLQMADPHEAIIAMADAREEFQTVTAPMQAAIEAGLVTLRPSGRLGLDQIPLCLNLPPKAARSPRYAKRNRPLPTSAGNGSSSPAMAGWSATTPA